MESARLVCAGIVTVDMAFAMNQEIMPGLKNRAAASFIAPGGCALNAARAAARLGGQVSLIGVIGDDMLGHWMCQQVEMAGIETHQLIRRDGEETARSAVLLTGDGERTIVNYRRDSLYECGIAHPDLTGAGAVLADTRWPQGAKDLILAARNAGLPAVLDAEAPVTHAQDALRAASHVAFSEQGLADFAGGADAAALSRAASELGAWVCVTRGPHSVLCHDGIHLSDVPTFGVTAVDTLGAGDVWHGAFALALAQGRTEIAAVRFANAVAALKTTRTGSAALPDRTEVEKFLEEEI